jgi:hypothetical protein
MAKYAREQMENAETVLRVLSSMSADEQKLVVMMTNSFIAGYLAAAQGSEAPVKA